MLFRLLLCELGLPVVKLISFKSIPCESFFKAVFQATFQAIVKNE